MFKYEKWSSPQFSETIGVVMETDSTLKGSLGIKTCMA